MVVLHRLGPDARRCYNMHQSSNRGKRRLAAVSLASAAAVLAVAAAAHGIPPGLTAVPDAQPKQTGISSPNAISPELALIERARGSMPLENPAGAIAFYGYSDDGPMVPAPGDTQTPGHNVEA